MYFQRGFPSDQNAVAAQLYADAFQRKFVKLLGSKAKIAELFELGIDPEFCFVAIDENENVVGLLGFKIGKEQLITLKLEVFQQVFGKLSGWVRSLAISTIFHRKPESSDQLLMDGVAVSALFRGNGIGSRLFAELIAFAKENNFKSVRLDVIDENPRAQALYKSIGFTPIKHKKVPWPINILIGVSGVTTMKLEL